MNKISSIHYVIDNLEKEYPILKEKCIILMIHKKRIQRNNKIQREEQQELKSFFNDDYYKTLIDNLH